MQCRKCGNQFPTKIHIDGRLRNLQNRKYCPTCSPFKQHNTRSLDSKNGICTVCGNRLLGNQTRYCSSECKRSLDNTSTYQNQKTRAITRKLHFVKLLGGCCAHCGYAKNLASLTFHHLDPSKKKYNLDARSLSSAPMKLLEEEIRNCLLLCHNCHQELHHPELTISLLNLKSPALTVELPAH